MENTLSEFWQLGSLPIGREPVVVPGGDYYTLRSEMGLSKPISIVNAGVLSAQVVLGSGGGIHPDVLVEIKGPETTIIHQTTLGILLPELSRRPDVIEMVGNNAEPETPVMDFHVTQDNSQTSRRAIIMVDGNGYTAIDTEYPYMGTRKWQDVSASAPVQINFLPAINL